MKYKSLILTTLTLLTSIFLSLWLCEFAASLWLARGSTAFACPNWETGNFAASRGYSLEHAFYEPQTSVVHCQPEYSYTYHIDHNGFRSHMAYRNNPSVLAIGDSFIFGFGVKDEEAFPALLGAYNAGMWGNPFDVQFKAFQRDIELVHPDIVVWGIYPPHIITMMPGEWMNSVPGDKTLFTTESPLLRKLLDTIPFQKFDKSSLVKLAYKPGNIREIVFDGNNLKLHRDGYQTKEAILFDRSPSSTQYTDSENINTGLIKDRDAILTQMQGYFKSAKQLAERKNIKVVFFIIPSRLNLRLHDGTAKLAVYKNAVFDADEPAALVGRAIKNAGFSRNNILDLGVLPQLRSGNWKSYYFEKDAHWNPSGHQLVADALKQKIALP